jgi:hypothetical protein
VRRGIRHHRHPRREALHSGDVHVARVGGETLDIAACGIDGRTATQRGVLGHTTGEHARHLHHRRAIGAVGFDVERGENLGDANKLGGELLRGRRVGDDIAIVLLAHEEAIVAPLEAHEVVAALRAANANFVGRARERRHDDEVLIQFAARDLEVEPAGDLMDLEDTALGDRGVRAGLRVLRRCCRATLGALTCRTSSGGSAATSGAATSATARRIRGSGYRSRSRRRRRRRGGLCAGGERNARRE